MRQAKAQPLALAVAGLLALIGGGAAVAAPSLQGVFGAVPVLAPLLLAILGLLCFMGALSSLRGAAAPTSTDAGESGEEDGTPGVTNAQSLELLASNRAIAWELKGILAALDGVEQGLIVVGPAGRILLANTPAAPFLTLPTDSARGRAAKECLRHPEVVALLADGQDEAQGAAGRSAEVTLANDKGEQHFHVSTGSQADHGADTVRAVVFRDISRLRRLEQVEAEFVENLGNALTAPLTAIRATARGLAEHEPPDPASRRAQYHALLDEANRLPQLLDNLLNYGLLSSGMATLKTSPTSLRQLVERAADQVRPLCGEKGLSLSLELPARLPSVDVDPALFHVAVMNILQNAVTFTPPGGRVAIYTVSQEESFQVSIQDTGPGISEEDQGRIFDKFRGSGSILEKVQGSGVGLATALQIVRLHGGELLLESEPGEGSCFTIVLPREAIEPA